MKYRDVITLFVGLVFLLSLAYAIGVVHPLWFWVVPLVFFLLLVVVIIKLWL
ncbi:MAG: hypothetical protein V1726_07895 [Methanobacteriota archaeon]